MINLPTKNPRKAAAIALGLGVATVLVSRFLPTELATWSAILDIIGSALGGTGAVQYVTKPQPQAKL